MRTTQRLRPTPRRPNPHGRTNPYTLARAVAHPVGRADLNTLAGTIANRRALAIQHPDVSGTIHHPDSPALPNTLNAPKHAPLAQRSPATHTNQTAKPDTETHADGATTDHGTDNHADTNRSGSTQHARQTDPAPGPSRTTRHREPPVH